jgi:hypothetical protein
MVVPLDSQLGWNNGILFAVTLAVLTVWLVPTDNAPMERLPVMQPMALSLTGTGAVPLVAS